MIHPLFRLLVSEPQLLADHVEAYSELVAEEMSAVTTQWKKRAALHAISLVAMLVALLLIGVALLLWAAIPLDSMNAPWALIVVPAAFLALGVWAHFSAGKKMPQHGVSAIREQLQADAAMLRSVTSS